MTVLNTVGDKHAKNTLFRSASRGVRGAEHHHWTFHARQPDKLCIGLNIPAGHNNQQTIEYNTRALNNQLGFRQHFVSQDENENLFSQKKYLLGF